jgi:hypothetical protein
MLTLSFVAAGAHHRTVHTRTPSLGGSQKAITWQWRGRGGPYRQTSRHSTGFPGLFPLSLIDELFRSPSLLPSLLDDSLADHLSCIDQAAEAERFCGFIPDTELRTKMLSLFVSNAMVRISIQRPWGLVLTY